MKQNYKFLDDINFPSDLRKISENNLQEVSNEVRKEMISAVSKTGGHLGAGLGVVELTVALHYVFDTPNDKLIWDGRSGSIVVSTTACCASAETGVDRQRIGKR